MARYEHEIEELFDALTEYRCTSYEDIGQVTGWASWKTAAVLGTVRSPEIAGEWGWTVPHVPRGPGDHWFQVIAVDNEPLDDEQFLYIGQGAVSTLRHTESMNQNEAHALRLAADAMSGADARQLRRTATACEGAAAMAGDMAERLTDVFVLDEHTAKAS